MVKKIICITGPTATGKSSIAIELAKYWPIEIINMDSATIYRGMNIGTAKPSLYNRSITTQHLIDIREPYQTYSAADFCHDANLLIKEIIDRGNMPMIVGGTMMYYNSLRFNLDLLPTANKEIRQDIESKANIIGWSELHKYLSQIDSEIASKIAPNDKQRIQRAIEIYTITGKPMSSLLNIREKNKNQISRYITISLEPPEREYLHKKIIERFNSMIENGLIEEVYSLYCRRDLGPELPSIKCVGYKQIWEFFEKKISLNSAIEKSIIATKKLAKKQMTWLRAQKERTIIDCSSNKILGNVLDGINTILNRP
ncbi:tRNA dimethylallyltransferase [Candidatus Kinetoplastibacterium blastocrithidii TCC012E]|uniref:tRNA dimethylallyltransferase n=1 Tax=Candidatus Kinetoplastidibacterium blastocrithidiae TCC012E TaxID=1208922 RepID=M1ME23_9PROT|nr:tRNA (adenosine(37)-N6)-dimethylallyltransferase MiaA [Candidatus Kinetoplastibacterium blastocrithidii]AFZ83861.1 tRNA delta(2)-isopentenylpyrophosphate transferase [Candidatus Kinetoplastibacterium blastocrithidii (ex Strigomonas culicis)]AGF49980.1 tRNA dimethylallyltransferase [Candidatus Kinetoplastibacterium blastocrithidii TCC012E]